MSGRGLPSLASDAGWTAAMAAARWRCTCRGSCGIGHQARTVGSRRTARDGQCPVQGSDASPLHAVPGPDGLLVAVCDECQRGQVQEQERRAVVGSVSTVPVQVSLFDMPVVTR